MDFKELFTKARKGSISLLELSDDKVSNILTDVANALELNERQILLSNAQDVGRMDEKDPKRDRLMLNSNRIKGIAEDMRNVAALPSPRKIIDRRIRPNGLEITRVAVPFGVVGVIYEARPNVTADVFSLCFKSGNACVLKGGHDADDTNVAIVGVIHEVLIKHGINPAVLTLLPSTREAGDALMHARGLVDVIIPRGSRALIDYVRENASVPIIETGAGVCHCYVDKSSDNEMASKIVLNAKTRRVSVCNALDCMIIHAEKLDDICDICTPLKDKEVVIYADSRAFQSLSCEYPKELLRHAKQEDYGREFLSMSMSIKTVDSYDEALAHIQKFGSGHSETVVTQNTEVAERFWKDVDAACVYVNAPTSFTDGAQFGLGAEIGISTQKLHARGPMALDELMTYKWLIKGNGQIRIP